MQTYTTPKASPGLPPCPLVRRYLHLRRCDIAKTRLQALIIHGGGFMTLSKSAIRPAQTRFLLAHGILPISLDHRLCPEINIIDGPMADVRDAVLWARSTLPNIVIRHDITVETENIAVIGYSTGGHLAMTTAWTTINAGFPPPTAILNFYGPSDMEALGEFSSAPGLPETQLNHNTH